MPQSLSNPLDNFLNGVTQPIASGLGNSITQALFGRSDRISNRDYQFYQDLADSGNPREINRQNQFLSGVTPNNADNYNLYQDMTQPRDTQRQVDRINALSSGTGVSQWELVGAGGASPLPSATIGPTSGRDQAGSYLSALAPLKIAELNAKTSLATTAMNNQTQKEINDQNTNNGANPVADTKIKERQADLIKAQEGLAYTQADAAENQSYLATIETLARYAGTTTVDLGPYKTTTTNNYPELAKLYARLQNPDNPSDFVSQYVKGLPADQFARMKQDAVRAAKTAIEAGAEAGKAAMDAGGNFMNDAGKFLGGMFSGKSQPVDPKYNVK